MGMSAFAVNTRTTRITGPLMRWPISAGSMMTDCKSMIFYEVISVLLCVATIVTNYLGYDVTALAGLAGASLLTSGAPKQPVN